MRGRPGISLRYGLLAGVLLVSAAGAGADMPGGTAPLQNPGPTDVTTSRAQYAVPDVTMVRQDAARVSLLKEMDDGRPVVLNFIFTTCGSICPLMSQVFGQFQRQLGPDRAKVHLMSISTDPEED